MAKFWETGQVKTRLGADITLERSARLHCEFVHHLCANLAEVDAETELVMAPDSKLDACAGQLAAWNLQQWSVVPQGKGDLGERMKRWFLQKLNFPSQHPRESCNAPIERPRAVLIGADCPLITTSEINVALEQLGTHDIVLGPALDGGYYLIGIALHRIDSVNLDRALDALFGSMAWSRADVLEITRERIEQQGWSLAVAEPREDIDTIAELDRLREELRKAPSTSLQNDSQRRLAESIERILRPLNQADLPQQGTP